MCYIFVLIITESNTNIIVPTVSALKKPPQDCLIIRPRYNGDNDDD